MRLKKGWTANAVAEALGSAVRAARDYDEGMDPVSAIGDPAIERLLDVRSPLEPTGGAK